MVPRAIFTTVHYLVVVIGEHEREPCSGQNESRRIKRLIIPPVTAQATFVHQ